MIDSQLLEKYISEDSSKIDGWFYPFDMVTIAQLDHIQSAMGLNGFLCEVGVYKGKSLVLLSHLAKQGERLFGFDLFPDNLLEETTSALSNYGSQVEHELIVSDTSSLTTEFLRSKFTDGLRILHIDAGHEYHEVLHQMMMFAQYVKEGGIIIMDDYQDREFPGIEAAVLAFSEIDRPRRFVPFYSGANKIYLCEFSFASKYQEWLLNFDSVRNQARLTKVKDFYILVGGSKLPMAQEKILEKIRADSFPCFYDFNEDTLSNKAHKYDQLKHM